MVTVLPQSAPYARERRSFLARENGGQITNDHNRRRIMADRALRLAAYFGDSPEFWLSLQTHYDLKVARRTLRPEEIERIKAAVP
jgi:hypothetical protein